MRVKQKIMLHFDLTNCPQDVQLTLDAGDGKHFTLTAYSDAPEKLDQHRQQNKALRLISTDQLHCITQFVEDAEKSGLMALAAPAIHQVPLSTKNEKTLNGHLRFNKIPHSF